jgi:hypothetical protein
LHLGIFRKSIYIWKLFILEALNALGVKRLTSTALSLASVGLPGRLA